MDLVPELTFTERIADPIGPTTGSPLGERLCWSVVEARLHGPRIDASLAAPGADWIRLGPDGIRRQDQRLVFRTHDDAVVLMRYDVGAIRDGEALVEALTEGRETAFGDQYLTMVPVFDTGAPAYAWLTESVFVAEGRAVGVGRIEYAVYRVE